MTSQTSPTCFILFVATFVCASLPLANAQQRRAPAPPATKATPAPTARPVQIFGPSQSGTVSAPAAPPARVAPTRSPQARFFHSIQQANHIVTTLDGSRIAFNQLFSDERPTVFMFWATWCHVCHTAFDDWQAVYERYARQGLNVIALNVQDPSDSVEVKSFLREQRLSFPVYFAPRALHAQMTEGRMGTPMTFVFDREGNLAARLVGWTRGQGRQALENVARGVLSE
jgi:thiol-disulfide isomerase/thioredoxin